MGADLRVLVTRPAGQAEQLMRALRERGFVPLHLPLLNIEALDPLPGPEKQKVLDLERYTDLIFVSANAARIGLARIDDYWPQRPHGQRFWAVGESTARRLEAAGCEVEHPEGDMRSEGLLALPGLADLRGRRVLIVKGEGGRGFLEQQLKARGATVDTLQCYRRGEQPHDPGECIALASDPPLALILISSGEGLDYLSRLLQPREHTNLAAISLIVPSSRVAGLAQELGWQRVERAENASDPAMLAATENWREAHARETRH